MDIRPDRDRQFCWKLHTEDSRVSKSYQSGRFDADQKIFFENRRFNR